MKHLKTFQAHLGTCIVSLTYLCCKDISTNQLYYVLVVRLRPISVYVGQPDKRQTRQEEGVLLLLLLLLLYLKEEEEERRMGRNSNSR